MADAVAAEAARVDRQVARAATRASLGMEGRDVTRGSTLRPEQAQIVQSALVDVNTGNERKALQALASSESPAYSWAGYNDILDAQHYTGIDAAGNRVARGSEMSRRNENLRSLGAYDLLIRNGYDSITDPATRTTLRDRMQNFIRSQPTLRDAVTSGTPPYTVPNDQLDAALRDPALQAALAKNLDEIFKPDALPSSIEKNLRVARQAQEAAVRARTAKDTERTAANTALTTARDSLTEFASPTPTRPYTITSPITPPPPIGSKEAAMVTLDREMTGNADANVNMFSRNLREFQRVQQALDAARDGAEQRRLNAQLAGLNVQLARGRAASVMCTEYMDLAQERNGIDRAIADRTAAVTKADTDLVTLREKEAEAIRAVEDAEVRQRLTSTAFYRKIEQGLAEAAKKAVAQKTVDFITSYNKAREGAIDAAVTEHRGEVETYLNDRRFKERYNRWLLFGRRERINKGQARSDVRTLITQGPQVLVGQILEGAGVPADKRALLMQNSEAVKQLQETAIASALVAFAGSGGKFHRDALTMIATTEWGQQAVSAAIAKSDAAKQYVETVTGQGYTHKSVVEMMKDPKNRGKIIAALGLAAGIGLGAAVVAGPAAVGGALLAAKDAAGVYVGPWVDAAGKTLKMGADAAVGAAGAAGKGIADTAAGMGAAINQGVPGQALGEAAVATRDTVVSTVSNNADALRSAANPVPLPKHN